MLPIFTSTSSNSTRGIFFINKQKIRMNFLGVVLFLFFFVCVVVLFVFFGCLVFLLLIFVRFFKYQSQSTN